MTGTRFGTVAACAALLLVAGCGAARTSMPTRSTTTLTVFAAASLKQTFTDLGATFEATHPGTTVSFNFAGSSDLLAQLEQGAPADVFATADAATMQAAADDGLLDGAPVVFATNTLQIAVPPGNPAGVTGLADLGDPALTVVVCAPVVPCGAAAVTVQAAAGVTITPVSEEASVTDVLHRVQTGEADAGLVYVTDVIAADGKVDGVDIAQAAAATNHYSIAVPATRADRRAAGEFVDLITGADGRKTLADAGFGAP